MNDSIAIVGAACQFPDARSPSELWENVLAGRRAFRRLPDCRLRLDDYVSDDPNHADTTYATQAAVIKGYEFDRSQFRIVGTTFRSADMAHWLALDVASRALADAGFPDGTGLAKDQVGVLIGNSLTGEFSRANMLRLRWPYVRRVVDGALAERGMAPEERADFLESLEAQYKKPFPHVGDETLAGGLSNTIAGRICNYFGLRGGGYTVDAACASSLLAVANACSALVAGDIDIALAGGVDLSLDPFELVGFAKVGALAKGEMRVYDARSAGFWPGEGCGIVVLMRAAEAAREGRRVYALIRGWGVSSDGHGGITRPEVEGQKLALERAYRRAGFAADTVGYFEGHGTGTSIGDATELAALLAARNGSAATKLRRAAIGSIKANIGHTKAAAGVAGLLKATLALYHQTLPPSIGWEQANSQLTDKNASLELLREGESWPAELPLRAGVSAMGFGGINAHVVLEAADTRDRSALGQRLEPFTSSMQDAEVFLFSAASREALARQIRKVESFAAQLSLAELADLAAELARSLEGGSNRAAVVASRPAELQGSLETLLQWLADGTEQRLDVDRGTFLAAATRPPAVGFLFPGQGTAASLSGGAWRRRFSFVRNRYDEAGLPAVGDAIATEIAHPANITAMLAGMDVLHRLGIEATVAIGHSLGELAAYHWAGALDEPALIRLATARGRAIAERGTPGGAMAGIAAPRQAVEQLLGESPVVVAGVNSPTQTVISGESAAVEDVIARAHAAGHHAVRLRVSHAFHSALVAEAVVDLSPALEREAFKPPQRLAVSTITGEFLDGEEDLRDLLRRQLVSPVLLMDAVRAAEFKVDLWIEVGPGHVLRGIVGAQVAAPVVSLDVGGDSLKDLLLTAAGAYVLGAPVKSAALFEDRFTRPFDLDWQPAFFANPCEMAPLLASAMPGPKFQSASPMPPVADHSPLEVVRALVAQRAELPAAAVDDNDRLLQDLHFSSIAVGSLVADAARALGLRPAVSPTDYAHATVAEVATALEELVRGGVGAAEHHAPSEPLPAGVDAWVRTFNVELVEKPLPGTSQPRGTGTWHVIAPTDDGFPSQLQAALCDAVPGRGVAVCLPPDADERHLPLLLEATRRLLDDGELLNSVATASDDTRSTFLLIQQGQGAASWARTLHLEMPHVTTCVLSIPANHPRALEWILSEVGAAHDYVEAHYDAQGTRREPVLRLLPTCSGEQGEPPLGPDDVLLVTGGGKGIAAECALDLAQQYGVRLALLGRSHADSSAGEAASESGSRTPDPQLRENLQRFTAAGVKYRYLSVDVTDGPAVRAAIDEIHRTLGPVTAILHGAGTNVPQSLRTLSEAAVRETLAPKLQGLQNVLSAVEADRLRLLVTFGSIIARTGLHGEAHYGLANEWLTAMTERWKYDHPQCRCLAVEWSVWSGVGMGERLGRIDALLQQGITPIGPDEGVRIMRQLIAAQIETTAVVVSGRFGNPPTLRLERPELPLLRFLEQPRVHVPGVELVVDVMLSLGSDPYLRDHVYQDTPLLPAVLGLEAMAQVSIALAGETIPPDFENVEFSRPVTVPQTGSRVIRLAGLVREPACVEIVLRSDETGFQADHFRAICRFDPATKRAANAVRIQQSEYQEQNDDATGPARLALEPRHDLYGTILFHEGRFRRVEGYRQLSATRCLADVSPDGQARWFTGYLPDKLILGDAAVRDAAIHAIQACIPHGTILPIGIDRVTFHSTPLAGPCLVQAEERQRDGDRFVYDVTIRSASGGISEQWEGLRLQRVATAVAASPWIEPLLGPYLERRLTDLVPGANASVAIVSDCGLRIADCGLENGTASPQSEIRTAQSSDRAIAAALGATQAAIHRRPDGKPVPACDRAVSVAHSGGLTLSIAGDVLVGCDTEPVAHRDRREWLDLLGPDRDSLADLIAHSTGGFDDAATRLWSAGECLKKAGLPLQTPLVLRSVTPDGWVLLAAGRGSIATWVGPVRNQPGPLAIALLVGSGNEVF